MSRFYTSHIIGAVNILKNGGIIVHPTETVYGIACDPFNREAYEKVKQLKKRDSKPLNQITEIEPLIWNLGIWRKNKNPMNTVIQAMREQRFGGI